MPVSVGRERYVKVAVNAGRPTALTFSYSVPAGREVVPGEVVHVPFGRRVLQGIVVDGPFDTPGFDREAVRPLEPPLVDPPCVPAGRMRLAGWLRRRYIAPPWEAYAVFLPPGTSETSRSMLVRGAGRPVALSAHQQAVFDALGDEARDIDELQRALRGNMPARAFDTAVGALVRRGLAERRYELARPRGRARVAEVARLLVAPAEAEAMSRGIAGSRLPRDARALQTLIDLGGSMPLDRFRRVARGDPTVEALLDEALVASSGDEVRLAVAADEAERLVRVRSRSRVDRAAADLLERLAGLARRERDPVLPLRELSADLGPAGREAALRLAEQGVLCIEEVLDRRDPLRELQVVRRPSVDLIGEQRQAASAVRDAIDRRDGTAFVLRGVTGSGKTEVYLDALAHAVAQGRRGIVLVPEIALTPQTVRRFSERFPGRVGVLHSGLSLGEAFDEWHEIERGGYDVVIGSRSAIFAPQPDLGLIVIDEAHEWTYKQHDPAPRYDARTVAAELGRLEGAAVIYGSATPDVERWYEAGIGELERLDLPRRIRPVVQPDGSVALWPHDEPPQTEIVDMRRSTTLFSPALVDALGETLERGEQAILFINRRGLAGYLLCPRGHSPGCSGCDVSLSLHQGNRLICHQCGRSRPLPRACVEQACGLPLRPLSAGTQRVEEEVLRHFPDARVLRWDRDTARSARSHRARLEEFMRREADVLVGTQMVAKGLDLPMVTLVGVVLADYTLREGDFRAHERTFQLLMQVSGRAGRAERDGRVIIQTMQPEHPAVLAAATHDLDRFYEDELAWRAEHEYPPFTRLVRLVFSHPRSAFAVEEASRLASELRRRAAGRPNIRIDGPVPPQVARVRGRHRWAILLRGDDPDELVRPLAESDELPPGWVIDVDPVVVN